MTVMIERTCQQCHSQFQAPRKNLSTRPVLFCGVTCMGLAKADPMLDRKCKHCGEPFQVKEWDAKKRTAEFCSASCRNKARSRPLAERFWQKVNKTGTCWLWTGALDGKGYGAIGVEGKRHTASRISYEMAHGVIPNGVFVCHSCDVPACVNPDHLFLGNASINMIDMAKKERGNKSLTADQVRQIRTRLRAGDKHRDIAKDFGVSYGLVGQINTRRARQYT